MKTASPPELVENPDSQVAVHERDQLLATVVHELRSPLVPIINGALVLQRRGVDPELVQATARIIERQGRLLGRLIADLLDISLVKLGAIQLHRERVSMSAIVDSCVQTMAAYISDRGQCLQVTMSEESMELIADATRLCQALQNVLMNAAKFSERGASIRMQVARDRGYAKVIVSDDGAGIDARHLEAIFTLYAQVGVGSSAGRDGLGIGLYLARRFVEAHGGTLTASSPGLRQGSTFTLRVPCAGPWG
jgi:signal transduction histidine kinase